MWIIFLYAPYIKTTKKTEKSKKSQLSFILFSTQVTYFCSKTTVIKYVQP